jgi:PhnB protein
MKQINPYLKFNGTCREALTFYKECLGGELNLQTVGGSPMESYLPPALKDQILHGSLRNGSVEIMGSDLSGQEGVKPGNAAAICVVCESQQEIESLFGKIGKGGKVGNPLAQLPFGTYGDLTDTYGQIWMFQFQG